MLDTLPTPALTVSGLRNDFTFEEWLDVGRALAGQRRQVDWLIGDWLNAGRERFHDQAQFDFLSQSLGFSPKSLAIATKAAKTFPPHLRDGSLTIEHHGHAAALPRQEQMTFLRLAKTNRWTAEQTRIEAVRLRAQEVPTLPRDDPDYDELMAIVRAWNRAKPNVRQQAAELIADSDLGVIDA